MGTFPLCVFTRNLDGQFFVEILKWHLLDQARAFHGDSWILIQDNDPNTHLVWRRHGCVKI